jgi:hypothetical protein
VLIRAGVTVGDAYVGLNGEGPLFGPALARAYDIESQEAIYPRVVVDEDAIGEHARDPRLRAEWNTLEYEREVVEELLATGDDGTRYVDYLRASRSEFERVRDWLGFLERHASVIQDGLAQAGHLRIVRKFVWLGRYHNSCVAKLREEISSSDAIADELFEDATTINLPEFTEKLLVRLDR